LGADAPRAGGWLAYRLETYADFTDRIRTIKRKLLSLLIEAKAAANRCSTYCASCTDFLDYAVDGNAYKQGRYLPGTHIPISPREDCRNQARLCAHLAGNHKDEIMGQLANVSRWGAKFAMSIPELSVI
jgi:hypothetical protein